MANKKQVNRENPKNIYCDHCKHFKNSGTSRLGCVVMVCVNPNSKNFQKQRYYYHRCKQFEWEEEA